MSTALVFGRAGWRRGCGFWQCVRIGRAPGCGTFAFSIFSTLSLWQVTQIDFTSACASTTLPSLAGAWHVSQDLSANGGCRNCRISFGTADWCGSWQLVQSAVAKG